MLAAGVRYGSPNGLSWPPYKTSTYRISINFDHKFIYSIFFASVYHFHPLSVIQWNWEAFRRIWVKHILILDNSPGIEEERIIVSLVERAIETIFLNMYCKNRLYMEILLLFSLFKLNVSDDSLEYICANKFFSINSGKSQHWGQPLNICSHPPTHQCCSNEWTRTTTITGVVMTMIETMINIPLSLLHTLCISPELPPTIATYYVPPV